MVLTVSAEVPYVSATPAQTPAMSLPSSTLCHFSRWDITKSLLKRLRSLRFGDKFRDGVLELHRSPAFPAEVAPLPRLARKRKPPFFCLAMVGFGVVRGFAHTVGGTDSPTPKEALNHD